MPVGRTNRREFIAAIGGRCGRSWRAAKRQQDANAGASRQRGRELGYYRSPLRLSASVTCHTLRRPGTTHLFCDELALAARD